jgi:hypothetical protein
LNCVNGTDSDFLVKKNIEYISEGIYENSPPPPPQPPLPPQPPTPIPRGEYLCIPLSEWQNILNGGNWTFSVNFNFSDGGSYYGGRDWYRNGSVSGSVSVNKSAGNPSHTFTLTGTNELTLPDGPSGFRTITGPYSLYCGFECIVISNNGSTVCLNLIGTVGIPASIYGPNDWLVTTPTAGVFSGATATCTMLGRSFDAVAERYFSPFSYEGQSGNSYVCSATTSFTAIFND